MRKPMYQNEHYMAAIVGVRRRLLFLKTNDPARWYEFRKRLLRHRAANLAYLAWRMARDREVLPLAQYWKVHYKLRKLLERL